MLKAWEAHKQTAEYANSKRWATDPNHVEGSLWALFVAGYASATQRAADLHEQIDSASDAERLEKLPGAGAMGAVIEYRDKIRQTVAA
jgi:hypothetical protein